MEQKSNETILCSVLTLYNPHLQLGFRGENNDDNGA